MAQPAYTDREFKMDETGVWCLSNRSWLRLSDPLKVLARIRDHADRDVGRLLEWTGAEGAIYQWAAPKPLLIGTPHKLFQSLAGGGFCYDPRRRRKEMLQEFIMSRPVNHCVRIGNTRDVQLLRRASSFLRLNTDSFPVMDFRLKSVARSGKVEQYGYRLTGGDNRRHGLNRTEMAFCVYRWAFQDLLCDGFEVPAMCSVLRARGYLLARESGFMTKCQGEAGRPTMCFLVKASITNLTLDTFTLGPVKVYVPKIEAEAM